MYPAVLAAAVPLFPEPHHYNSSVGVVAVVIEAPVESYTAGVVGVAAAVLEPALVGSVAAAAAVAPAPATPSQASRNSSTVS